MSGNWSDYETRELLTLRGEKDVLRQIRGTVRDSALYTNMTSVLQKRGVQKRKPQIISKLKKLRRHYNSMKTQYTDSEEASLYWPYFQLCDAIWGNSRSEPETEDKTETIKVEPEDGAVSGSESTSNPVVEEEEELEEEEEQEEEEGESPPGSPYTPLPKKRQRKKSNHQQTFEDLRKFLVNMDRDFNEIETVRLKEQREYENRVRTEVREYERQERATHMATWKEMQEAQNSFFKDILSQMSHFTPSPAPALQQQLLCTLLRQDHGQTETQLRKTQTDVQQRIHDRLKKIQEIKHSAELFKRNIEKEKADSVEVFTALIHSIERSQAELLEVMEEKQKAAERQAEGLIKELEQEITVLKRRDTELEQLSHTEDHLHLLQISSSMCSPPHTKNWTEISINTDLTVDTVRTALSQLQQTLNDKLIKSLKKTVSTELKRIQQYAVDVTLDPDTAHPNLVLSADGKQVTHGDIWQNLSDTPERFNFCVCVLGKQSFSSKRFYYEVQVRGKTAWDFGVAAGSINRKGDITLTPRDGFWTLALRNEKEYKAYADPDVHLTLREKVEKVGVFVDYEEGSVSFYDVKGRSHIYSFIGQTFTEKLYPYFSPHLKEGGKNTAPLIISPVFKTE
ncbi:zinc finger protein RFP-like [Clarias gariepinus]|uniref:zinc finger protein RFP-like n=1 Tax=Clarias gariepinus TaxID=13013 RepID=UPI00234C98F5|nr:zinc finger protein RFP-like [Clarias gariepinus]